MKQIEKHEEIRGINNKSFEYITRIILILTFIATTIGTYYAVRTSRRAIEISDNDLRPWISLSHIKTIYGKDSTIIAYDITNIGKLPAYINNKSSEVFINGKKLEYEEQSSNPKNKYIVLLPSQSIEHQALSISGESCKRFNEGKREDDILLDTYIKYKTSMCAKGDYYIRQKNRLDKKSNYWELLEADYR